MTARQALAIGACVLQRGSLRGNGVFRGKRGPDCVCGGQLLAPSSWLLAISNGCLARSKELVAGSLNFHCPGMIAVLMSPLRFIMCCNTCCKRESGASPVM